MGFLFRSTPPHHPDFKNSTAKNLQTAARRHFDPTSPARKSRNKAAYGDAFDSFCF
jgi:hypothetical protein